MISLKVPTQLRQFCSGKEVIRIEQGDVASFLEKHEPSLYERIFLPGPRLKSFVKAVRDGEVIDITTLDAGRDEAEVRLISAVAGG